MVHRTRTHPPERLALVRWAAGLGAVTAGALAEHANATVASARSRLNACERTGLMQRRALLACEPALYTVTPAGMRACGAHGIEPARVTATNAAHALACARAASALERAYPDHRVIGERELRRDERASGRALASARVGRRPDGGVLLHRPDLVLWPALRRELAPVAVEVELTVKAPRRLQGICRAWARCDCVSGVLYLIAADVRRPLERAIAHAHAGERLVIVALDAI